MIDRSSVLERHGLTPDEYDRIVAVPRARAEPHRARHLLGDVVRALQLQELARPPEDAADRGAAGAAGPGRERRRRRHRRRPGGGLQDRIAQPSRRSSSRIRARRPASAASSATSSRWARGRSRCSTRCASARSTRRRTPRLVEGVVAGIAGYGNCIGIPTVGGEVAFEPCYAGNPLVNVFCLGIAQGVGHRQGRRRGRRQPGLLRRREDRPRRHPRRDDGVGGVRRASRPRSGRPCRSAIRSWRSCCSRPASR